MTIKDDVKTRLAATMHRELLSMLLPVASCLDAPVEMVVQEASELLVALVGDHFYGEGTDD
jgi:hypothetical protein